VKGSEQEYIHNKLKEHYPNFINDSWDGKDLNVMNDQSRLYKEQMKRTGLPLNIVKAGNWASMVGQNKNTNDFSSVDYLDETNTAIDINVDIDNRIEFDTNLLSTLIE
jgi:hypothetical protein